MTATTKGKRLKTKPVVLEAIRADYMLKDEHGKWAHSWKSLMQKYHVSVSTVQRAVAILPSRTGMIKVKLHRADKMKEANAALAAANAPSPLDEALRQLFGATPELKRLIVERNPHDAQDLIIRTVREAISERAITLEDK